LGTQQAGDKSLELKDPKTNQVVAFLNQGGMSYNRQLIDKAFYYIDLGISKFPQRLDMRFGKIYILGEISNYDEFSREIVKTIEHSTKINLKWTWIDNKTLEDAKNFMLGNIQTYVGQLYNAGDTQLINMRVIAQAVLKEYPDHVESLSNLAITYLLKNDYDTALPPLLKAAEIAPTDGVVLGNIAYCYNAKGDKTNAIKYYELTQKYGTEQSKAFATKKLEELKK
jgi:tetratricopeptide (TPR) repeat protein